MMKMITLYDGRDINVHVRVRACVVSVTTFAAWRVGFSSDSDSDPLCLSTLVVLRLIV